MTTHFASVFLSFCITSVTTSFAARAYSRAELNSVVPVAPTAKQLYKKHCASCHGLDGQAKTTKGRFNHARNLADANWQDDVTDERIFNSIMNGREVRGNMPAFSDKFSEAQLNSLVTFVRGLRK
jgi:mono/diheme cytochrome c family protein